AFWAHVGHSFANAFRAWGRAWTGGLFAPAPAAGAASRFYKSLGRYTSAFALAAGLALLTLGGGLQRPGMVAARFGHIPSEPYLLSAVLKGWEDEGRQSADLPLLEWNMESGFATIEARFDEIFANFRNRPAAWLLRFMLLPLGLRRRGPSDRLTQACAEILLTPSARRDRLTVDIFHGLGDEGLARLERAFALVVAAQPLRDRLHEVHARDVEKARLEGLISDPEAQQLRAAADAVAAAVAVDDFAPEALSPRQSADPVPLKWNPFKRNARATAASVVRERWAGPSS